MATTAMPSDRIVTLDVVRGVAVMGILAMNIVAFALPQAAYMNPAAYGTEGPADLASWVFSFLFIDGRMRGLFSFLFGASMLLVIDRAAASGRSAAGIHYARMGWLLVFGLLHFYLFWFGDILGLYALVGMIAFAFRNCSVKTMLWWAAGLLVVQLLLFSAVAATFFAAEAAASAPGASREAVTAWQEMQRGMGVYTPAELQTVLDRHRGSFGGLVTYMITHQASGPLQSLFLFGWETLAYMLLGMAALRTGFLTGQWTSARYLRTVAIGFGVGVPVYAGLAYLLVASDFHVPTLFAGAFAATVPIRPLMIAAVAALVILLTRGGGALVTRIGAAGRAAFTNYLGTSILMTAVFNGWGLGWFGYLSRVELWPVVIVAWALMLLWSKPWLDRFEYGPLEWMWRCLSRGRLEPLRRPSAAAVPLPA